MQSSTCQITDKSIYFECLMLSLENKKKSAVHLLLCRIIFLARPGKESSGFKRTDSLPQSYFLDQNSTK